MPPRLIFLYLIVDTIVNLALGTQTIFVTHNSSFATSKEKTQQER